MNRLSASVSCLLLIGTSSGDKTVKKIQQLCGFWSVKEGRNYSWRVQ